MSTRAELPDFRGNEGKFLKVNPTETNVLWDVVDASDISGVLGIDHGGTGADNATDALNNLLPDQTGHSNEALFTDGTDPFWGPASSGGSDYITLPLSSGMSAQPFNFTNGSPVLTNTDFNTFNPGGQDTENVFGETMIVKKIFVRAYAGSALTSSSSSTGPTVLTFFPAYDWAFPQQFEIFKNGVSAYSVGIPCGSFGNTGQDVQSQIILPDVTFGPADTFSTKLTSIGDNETYALRYPVSAIVGGPFVVGETITFASTGMTAEVLEISAVTDAGATAILIGNVVGNFPAGKQFPNNESRTFTGGTSGAVVTDSVVAPNNNNIFLMSSSISLIAEMMLQRSNGSALGVQGVTGDTVDNTDPFNPVIVDNVLKIKVTVSSAEILDNFNTAKVLIPAPGAGKYVKLISADMKYNYGTTPYALSAGTSASSDTRFFANGTPAFTGSGFIVGSLDSILLGSDSTFFPVTITAGGGFDSYAENTAVTMMSVYSAPSRDYISGDGTIEFYISYQINDL